jgi:CheY-like chemotaxis protein/anti-sigma regulatory factor (Ser/Thr protein kinase)
MAEADEITIRRAPVDIPALTNDVIHANRPLAEKKEQKLAVAMPASLMVTGDHDRLREAIDNLVSNAIKYTQPGGSINLAVSTNEDQTFITVADNGPGLTSDDLGRLFGRFQRLSAKPTGGESSTGLGLSIVKRIVELHGGKVSAQSAGMGRGSHFTIALPLMAATSVSHHASSGEQATVLAKKPDSGMILVVDDNKEVREALDVLLESDGISAVFAASADEALAVVAGKGLRPSLIVSDYNLHGAADGIENIVALRGTLGWQVPAILLTGDSTRLPKETMVSNGLVALTKPWKGDEFTQLIRQLQKSEGNIAQRV